VRTGKAGLSLGEATEEAWMVYPKTAPPACDHSERLGVVPIGDEVNLGGSIETLHNPVSIAEIAVEKGATAILMPVACRRQLVDLSDDMATKIDIQFYSDTRDPLLKAISEGP
jgi:ATP-dependent Lon protease